MNSGVVGIAKIKTEGISRTYDISRFHFDE
jgi:hypothetical protein